MIAQDASLVPFLTARENVELGLQVRSAKGNAVETLASVGLAELAEQRVDRLSMGERRRSDRARALIAAPALLLADEPGARLDEANAVAVGDLLARVVEESETTVVFSTHDPVLAGGRRRGRGLSQKGRGWRASRPEGPSILGGCRNTEGGEVEVHARQREPRSRTPTAAISTATPAIWIACPTPLECIVQRFGKTTRERRIVSTRPRSSASSSPPRAPPARPTFPRAHHEVRGKGSWTEMRQCLGEGSHRFGHVQRELETGTSPARVRMDRRANPHRLPSGPASLHSDCAASTALSPLRIRG